jgi:hypothetical protein
MVHPAAKRRDFRESTGAKEMTLQEQLREKYFYMDVEDLTIRAADELDRLTAQIAELEADAAMMLCGLLDARDEMHMSGVVLPNSTYQAISAQIAKVQQ